MRCQTASGALRHARKRRFFDTVPARDQRNAGGFSQSSGTIRTNAEVEVRRAITIVSWARCGLAILVSLACATGAPATTNGDAPRCTLSSTSASATGAATQDALALTPILIAREPAPGAAVGERMLPLDLSIVDFR